MYFYLPPWLLKEENETIKNKRIDATLATNHSHKHAVTKVATILENPHSLGACVFCVSHFLLLFVFPLLLVVSFFELGFRSSSAGYQRLRHLVRAH